MHYFSTIALRVTSNTSRSAYTHARKRRIGLIHLLNGYQYFVDNIYNAVLNCKISYLLHLKRQKVYVVYELD